MGTTIYNPGATFTCGITVNGNVKCWGCNVRVFLTILKNLFYLSIMVYLESDTKQVVVVIMIIAIVLDMYLIYHTSIWVLDELLFK